MSISNQATILNSTGTGTNEHFHNGRVLIVGLDSADWSIVDKLLERGDLPNIARILDGGLRSDLLTTIPDMTPPAWTSFITGVNPARHNVYGFFQPIGNKIKLTNSKSRRAPAIWELMDKDCIKLLMNIPLSYPVAPINGCIVSDNLTSSKSGEWVWPITEKEHLLKLSYDKCLISSITETKRLEQLTESVQVRADSFRYLMDKFAWCFGMIVFSETDWIQHLFPSDIDSISKVYQNVDHFLGDLLANQKHETLLILASDHGYNVAKRKFLTNNWLVECGLMDVGKPQSIVDKLLNPMIERSTFLAPYLFKLVPRQLSLRIAVKVRTPENSLERIKGVYSIGWDLGQYLRLHITSNEKEKYEIYFQKLCKMSKELIDPKTGRSPIIRVIRKGESYHGPYLTSAPDFIIELDPEYSGIERIFKPSGIFLDYKAGIHRKNGVLISKWLNVPSQTSKSINYTSIYDVAPTVLRVFDRDLRITDGKVIKEILTIDQVTHNQEKPVFS